MAAESRCLWEAEAGVISRVCPAVRYSDTCTVTGTLFSVFAHFLEAFIVCIKCSEQSQASQEELVLCYTGS